MVLSLTKFADEVHGAVVAAVRGVQVYQKFDIQAGNLSLQYVGYGLSLVLLILPLPARHTGAPEEEMYV